MRRFETHYRLRENDSAVPETFNSRFKDFDDRLNDHDVLRDEILSLRDTVLFQAAQRIDDFIIPALERVREIQSGGFLVTDIAENTAVSFVEGEVSIAVNQSMKDIFRPTAFVALVRQDTADDWAVARALDYNEETGVIDLDILAVSGNAGPHEDVIVSATGGGAAGQIAFLLETREARDEAQVKADLASDWAEKAPGEDVAGAGTRSAKHHALAAASDRGLAQDAADAATGASGTATGAAEAAEDARDKAQAWADTAEDVEVESGKYSAKHHAAKAEAAALAAAAFDAESYYDKDAVDGLLASKVATSTIKEMATRDRASDAQIRGLSGDVGLTAERLASAAAQAAGVTQSGSNVAIAWDSFVTGSALTMSANLTMPNPTNIIPGTTRSFVLQSNSGTARSITSFGSYFKGNLPTISVTNTAKVMVHLFAYSATEIQIAVVPWS